MEFDRIGIMHWKACKTCKKYDQLFDWCSYGTKPETDSDIKPHLHVSSDEVVCLTYEKK